MSKELGQKIVIKFTQDLVGDVTGNEPAFSVAGREYQYVNGPLVDKTYQISNISRYPVQRLWSLGQTLQLDGSGELAITDSKCYEVTSGTSLSGTVYANANDLVLATVSHRSTFIMPAGWTKLYESEAIGSNQKMVFAIKHVDVTGEISFLAKQSTSGRIYLNLISIGGVTDIQDASEYQAMSTVATPNIQVPDKQVGEKLIWGASANLWVTSGFGSWTVTPNDLVLVSLPSTVQARQLNAIDDGVGEATGRIFAPNAPNSTIVVSAVRLIQEYETPKIYTSEAISLSCEYRIKWQETKPEHTDIVVEYTMGETQGQWQQVSNGDVVNADINVWIRLTLSTIDTAVTPTLDDLWLEELDAPEDALLLTLQPLSRFNNVEGNLTVSYDATKGNLAGSGGSVASFSEEFTPDGLLQKPNPNNEENIEISEITGTGNLIRIYYTDSNTGDDRIEIADISATGVLTHINDL